MATTSPNPLQVVQLSDLHFSTAPGGYMLRDTAETFAAVAAQVIADAPDLVVVTGDIANEGKPDEYAMAGAALSGLGLPVYCLPGNHDRVDAFHAYLPRPGIVAQRTLNVGNWLFLFGDSNAEGMVYDEADGWLDLDDRTDLANGGLTDHEFAWLRRQLDESAQTQAMLWIHHPPAGPGMFEQPGYDAQISELISHESPLLAIAAGHAHTGVTTEIGDLPSYFCPSTGVSIDFEAVTLMPPGYRRFEFAADGQITTEVVWLEDPRWSERFELPEWAAQYLAGQIGDKELKAHMDEMEV